MTYWTILWITILSGPLETVEMHLLYPSEALCLAGTRELDLPYDYKAECVVSDTLSASPRPKPRPANLRR